MALEELKKKHAELSDKNDKILSNMDKITAESFRVADVANNSRELIKDLDKEFESITGLNGRDVVFLFTAIGLQMTRIVILNELTKSETAGSQNRNETKLHEFQEKLLGRFNSGEDIKDGPYYASMNHIVTKMGVPYDASSIFSSSAVENMLGKGRTWDFDISSFILNEKIKYFKGANHRFSTLGHDPILGLIFGTSNIMTNTITFVKTPLAVVGVEIPILTTNHVIFTSDYKDPRIAQYGSTAIMLAKSIERTKEQPSALVASLIKQIIHIGTDLYTPCGIQIPGANLVLSNKNAEKLTQYISTGDIVKIGTSAALAEFINFLIGTIHSLMYDETKDASKELYSVRTRKIIMYSNVIATGSNALWVTGNMMSGNGTALKQLDIGGLIVLAKRLMTDTEYIRKIKEEFVLGGFKNMIVGEDLGLEEIPLI